MQREVARLARLHRLPRGLDIECNPGEVEPVDEAARLASLALRRALLNADPCIILPSTLERTADTRRECLHAKAER
jgi:hypothetical protein